MGSRGCPGRHGVQHLAAGALRQCRGEEVVVGVQVGAGGAALQQLGHAGVHAAVLDQLLHYELVHLRGADTSAQHPHALSTACVGCIDIMGCTQHSKRPASCRSHWFQSSRTAPL